MFAFLEERYVCGIVREDQRAELHVKQLALGNFLLDVLFLEVALQGDAAELAEHGLVGFEVLVDEVLDVLVVAEQHRVVDTALIELVVDAATEGFLELFDRAGYFVLSVILLLLLQNNA